MGEPIRQDLQDRMAPGVVIDHQASGWLAERKRMFKEGERKRGTFLILKMDNERGKGAMAVFLAVEDEASMQADALPFTTVGGHCMPNGDVITLPDGQRMIFAGGRDAAVTFLGAFLLALT